MSGSPAIVQTVTGPTRVTELGTVLMHEHVITASPGLREAYPRAFPRQEIVAQCIDGLMALKDKGVDTIVDHTPYDLGRDAELLATVSQASGVRIVAATGVWIEPQRFWQARAAAESAELLIADLEEGIAGTDIRAGVIKCAIDRAGLTDAVDRVLRACGIAHRATGVHISTHTIAADRNGLVQQRIFAQERVDLRRVVIGHCGDTTEIAYLEAMLESGSYLGMDRFGVEDILPDEARMDTVAALCRAGFADRLFLSQDASFWNDRMPAAALRRIRPRWNHRNITENIVPGLLQRGVTDDQIETMLVGNPRSLFGDNAPYPGPPSQCATANAWD